MEVLRCRDTGEADLATDIPALGWRPVPKAGYGAAIASVEAIECRIDALPLLPLLVVIVQHIKLAAVSRGDVAQGHANTENLGAGMDLLEHLFPQDRQSREHGLIVMDLWKSAEP